MNRFTFKTATVILLSLTFTNGMAKSPNKAAIYNTKLGCMACHIGTQQAKPSDRKSNNVTRVQRSKPGVQK